MTLTVWWWICNKVKILQSHILVVLTHIFSFPRCLNFLECFILYFFKLLVGCGFWSNSFIMSTFCMIWVFKVNAYHSNGNDSKWSIWREVMKKWLGNHIPISNHTVRLKSARIWCILQVTWTKLFKERQII